MDVAQRYNEVLARFQLDEENVTASTSFYVKHYLEDFLSIGKTPEDLMKMMTSTDIIESFGDRDDINWNLIASDLSAAELDIYIGCLVGKIDAKSIENIVPCWSKDTLIKHISDLSAIGFNPESIWELVVKTANIRSLSMSEIINLITHGFVDEIEILEWIEDYLIHNSDKLHKIFSELATLRSLGMSQNKLNDILSEVFYYRIYDRDFEDYLARFDFAFSRKKVLSVFLDEFSSADYYYPETMFKIFYLITYSDTPRMNIRRFDRDGLLRTYWDIFFEDPDFPVLEDNHINMFFGSYFLIRDLTNHDDQLILRDLRAILGREVNLPLSDNDIAEIKLVGLSQKDTSVIMNRLKKLM